LGPAARLWRARLARYRPLRARKVDRPCAAGLARVFERQGQAAATTVRDAAYIAWRYLEAPYADRLSFYSSGTAELPDLALVARTLDTPAGRTVRILDLFGDLGAADRVEDLVLTCLRDAALQGAVQVTAMASLPRLRSRLRRLGFVGGSRARFCWHSQSEEIGPQLGSTPCHFCLADSDNDEPG
jgi:hypothetical protein